VTTRVEPEAVAAAVRQEGSDGRGHQGSIQESLEGTRLLGVDLVEAIHRRVQPDAEFDLPAHAVEVADLQRAEPGGQVGEEKAVAFRGLNADNSEMKRLLRLAHMDVGIDGPAIQDEDLLREEGIEVRAGEELLGDLPAGDIVDVGLPGVLQVDHAAPLMRFARPEALQTGVAKIGQETPTPPSLVDGEMSAGMLPGGAAMVAPRRPAAAREDCMDRDGRVVPGPGKCLAQGVTNRDRRGLADVPVVHGPQWTGQIDLTCSLRAVPSCLVRPRPLWRGSLA
jgi:hypothetical protein